MSAKSYTEVLLASGSDLVPNPTPDPVPDGVPVPTEPEVKKILRIVSLSQSVNFTRSNLISIYN